MRGPGSGAFPVRVEALYGEIPKELQELRQRQEAREAAGGGSGGSGGSGGGGSSGGPNLDMGPGAGHEASETASAGGEAKESKASHGEGGDESSGSILMSTEAILRMDLERR